MTIKVSIEMMEEWLAQRVDDALVPDGEFIFEMTDKEWKKYQLWRLQATAWQARLRELQGI